MFTITTAWIGPMIIAIGATARKYILNHFNKNTTTVNILYIILLFCMALPFYIWQYKFTLSPLNDKTAKELVQKSLKADILNKYKLDIVTWKPYDKKKNLYNIKASVHDENNHAYYMYLQPTCKFFDGCKVGLDKILVLEPVVKNISIESINEKMFTQRVCSDKIVNDIMLKTNVEPFFKELFKKYNAIKNSQASYRIDKLALKDFKQTKIIIKNLQSDKLRYSNSCQATLYIRGDFNIKFKNRDYTKNILYSMFDKVKPNSHGYLIKTKANYNIYINPKTGSVNLNSMFVDLGKMKKMAKKMKSNEQETPFKKSGCKFDIKSPQDMIVLAGGNYGGKPSSIQIDSSGHEATKFDVTVNYPNKPVALFLSAYEPSIWNIKWTKGTKIEAVYVSGNHRQIVLGIPNSTPLINSTHENRGNCGSFNISSRTVKGLNPISKRVFGKDVKIAYLAKKDGKIVFGKIVSQKSKLYTSNERKLSQFIDKSKPLAGQAGLRELAKKGYLRASTKEDMDRWAKLQEDTYKKRRNSNLPKVINGNTKKSFRPGFVLHGYAILKKITIPAGLYGGNAATFFLQKGVSFPDGKLGHSTLYDFNTGKCYGILCGHI